MQHARAAERYGCSRIGRVYAFSSGFGKYDFHIRVVEVMVDCSCRVASPTHAGHEVIGRRAPFVLAQLVHYLCTYYGLQPCNHVGIRVRAYGGAYNVVRVVGMAAPVAYGLVGGVLERPVARGDGHYRSPEHFHLLDV